MPFDPDLWRQARDECDPELPPDPSWLDRESLVAMASQLHESGWPFSEIAHAFGRGKGTVFGWVTGDSSHRAHAANHEGSSIGWAVAAMPLAAAGLAWLASRRWPNRGMPSPAGYRLLGPPAQRPPARPAVSGAGEKGVEG